MTEPAGNQAGNQAEAFIRMWADFASRMAGAGMAFSPDASPPQMTREMRDATLNAMGEQCNAFMRSPQFLDMIKQSMRASIEMRKQMNDFLGKMHHDMQGASRQDIDQIMLGLQHLERRMVDVTERVDQHLNEVTARLDAIEAAATERTARTGRGTSKSSTSTAQAQRKRSSKKPSTRKTKPRSSKQ